MSESEFLQGSPKTMFTFGLVTGVAVSALLAMFFFVGGNAALVSNGATTGAAPAAAPTQPTAPSAPAAAVAPATSADWVRGDLKKAKVVLIEYSDYQCPFCGRHHPSMQQAVAEYGDKVAWVYRHFPLSFHPNAQPAALAAECVGEQKGNDGFWKFSDAMFTNQDGLSDDFYKTTAQGLGVDVAKYDICYTGKKYASKVADQEAGGQAAGVSGTPATFVNGQLISGAVPYATMKAAIDAALK